MKLSLPRISIASCLLEMSRSASNGLTHRSKNRITRSPSALCEQPGRRYGTTSTIFRSTS